MKGFKMGKKKMGIIAGAVVAAITIGTISVNANAAMKVESYTADIGGLSSILEISDDTIANYNEAAEGIRAEFDGVVVKLKASKYDIVHRIMVKVWI